jgi:hypothetical protein
MNFTAYELSERNDSAPWKEQREPGSVSHATESDYDSEISDFPFREVRPVAA